MKGKFYGIGVGPGDPDLLTIKAKKVLNDVDIILAPETKDGKGSTALNIAKPHLNKNIEIIEKKFPMTYDVEVLNKSYDEISNFINKLVNDGKKVAFLTLGDPMVYSTYIYLFKRLKEKDIDIETIPGITSFCAIASKVGVPLGENEETIAIVPSVYYEKGDKKLEEILNNINNIVFMKASGEIDELIDELEISGHKEGSVFVSRLGLDDEIIERDIEKRKGIKNNYLSTLIAKKNVKSR
ncbi:precorrin-2 C(20)-methyltransferase [Paramaledivibacter caminithermalis]|jgi:precorrin-2/cobalt-factor-2 C20-methyltransferase|uniref:Precorrin-2/cobalt-factor-2 C20-methyltransferase n=1 Tax=Paramaledivibacter caminithermalis (strain DSM 15212 / CIP 107654 / DViRD3) TaxID=1121301 RepID=A0A1M6MKR9_PARC5|nr:precorrin-2 C(20)-methyltransferase [Paramaledivibacter caminithermalis]SHJ84095.1 precorrin-2/cobalt-factor-2 C20-methyltransferase [Paramaledivibacter caminithermalis DSM 15212]